MKLKNYDHYLIILTTLILLAIGILCVYSITLYNYLSVDPRWIQTAQYIRYIDTMDSYLYPLLILLLFSLGLCIPKRLLGQKTLMRSSVLLLGAVFIPAFFSGIRTALFFLLAAMTVVQGIVLVMTLEKKQFLKFEKEGYVLRLGSSFVHLGLVILMLDFSFLRGSSFHIAIFWAGTILITAGNIMSFYDIFYPKKREC